MASAGFAGWSIKGHQVKRVLDGERRRPRDFPVCSIWNTPAIVKSRECEPVADGDVRIGSLLKPVMETKDSHFRMERHSQSEACALPLLSSM
jgi:hypothetical protein